MAMADLDKAYGISKNEKHRNKFQALDAAYGFSSKEPELEDENLPLLAARGYLAAGPGQIVDLLQGKNISEPKGYLSAERFRASPELASQMTGKTPEDISEIYQKANERQLPELHAEKKLTGLYDRIVSDKDLTPKTFKGKVAQDVGSFFSIPGSGIINSITKAPTIAKGALAFGKNFLKQAGMGTAISGTMHGAEELGAGPIASTALGLTVPFAAAAANRIGHGAKRVFSPSSRKASSDIAAKGIASDIFKKHIGEENIPAILQDFEKYEAPLSGYQPLTSETTKNVGLAQLQRAQYGHTPKLGEQQARNDALIKEGLQAIEAAPETMSDIANRTAPFTAGQELQGQLTKNISKLTAEREAAHAPAKKAVEEHKPGVYASKTYSLIDKELETAKGTLKSQLKKVRGYLTSNKAQKIDVEGFSAEMARKALEQAGNLPSANELKETISQIGDMISVAKRNGADKRANKLMKIKESLYEDLINTPVKEANVIYAEKSKPISKIKELFGAEASRDVYNQRYLMRQDKASESIISKAMQNPEFAEGFNAQFSHHPESMKVTRGYINNDLHKTVIDKNGYVNLDKLHSWKVSNPHVETIYPGITKKLDNLQKKGLVDKLNTYLKDEKNITYDKLNKFIKENEAMLNESLDANQMKVLRGSELALSGRHAAEVRAKSPGSPTASNIELLQAIQQNVPAWILKQASKGSISGQAGVWLYNFFRVAKKAKAEELINAALMDRDVAKLLATHTNDVKTLESTANKLKNKSYIPRVIIMNSQRKEEKSNE